MKKRIYNETGALNIMSTFIVLAVTMLMSFMLLFASVQINCINIRNAAKMELNNISARIYADTYHSQREVDLNNYSDILHISQLYQNKLQADFVNGLATRIPLSNTNYTVQNIQLQYAREPDKITYEMSCDVTFHIQMFGNQYPITIQQILLTGSHIIKI